MFESSERSALSICPSLRRRQIRQPDIVYTEGVSTINSLVQYGFYKFAGYVVE